MNEAARILLFMVSCVLTNNFVFSRALGCCPLFRTCGRVETAFGMGLAVTFVMATASLLTWVVYRVALSALGLAYMSTIFFVLIIAAIVQLAGMFINKSNPSLYKSLGMYLPLMTTNCAVLGVTVLNIREGYGLMDAVLSGTFGALGFLLAIVLMAGVRERLETSDIPAAFRGVPISIIIAGLISVAFMGFSGFGS